MVLIPRLYFRHQVTGAMLPLTLGGSSGGNEVSVQSTAPTDGSDLWLDTTANVLKYRDPVSGNYVVVPGTGGDGGADGTIYAGNGLIGGGRQSTNPTLHVNPGTALWVDADSIHVNKGTLDSWYAPLPGHGAVTIADWNQAVLNNTAYMASGAANAPDTGWFFGYTHSHNSVWKHQTLFPFANGRWNSGTMFERECENGTWGDWNRFGTYMHSRDTLDGGVFAQHNGTGSSLGVRRCFWGMVKDKATNNASNADAWRVTYYNTAGAYVGRAIDIPLGTGVVSTPQANVAVRSALRAREPIASDTVATVGAVVDIVTALLARAGVTVEPAEVISLMEGQSE